MNTGSSSPISSTLGFGRDRRTLRRFCLTYVALVLALSTLFLSDLFGRFVSYPLSTFAAACSAATLGALGQKASSVGPMLFLGLSAIEIKNGCNGTEVLIVLLPAFLASPGPVWRKLTGIGFAVIGIYALNVIRVVTLSEIVLHAPALFTAAHIYVWQAAVIMAGLGYWLYWVQRVAVVHES